MEEAYFKQKSWIKWLKEGGQNTSFFSKVVQGKKSWSRITSLESIYSRLIKDEDGIMSEIVDFYIGLTRTADEWCNKGNLNHLKHLLPLKFPEDMKHSLIAGVSSEEILKTIKDMPSGKSPGPDGHTIEFFQSAWTVVGDQVFAAIQVFFSTRKLLIELHYTLITLVAKCSNPTKVAEFKPISCCNTVYKCITRIMTNGLKNCLPHLISLNQRAFIEERRIMDNILLGHEIVGDYSKNKGEA